MGPLDAGFLKMFDMAAIDKVDAWPETSMLERLMDCRLMLLIHGFLTEAEGDKVKSRIVKQYKKK
jgi:hypothetical protein